jgi:hypothetical protein
MSSAIAPEGLGDKAMKQLNPLGATYPGDL